MPRSDMNIQKYVKQGMIGPLALCALAGLPAACFAQTAPAPVVISIQPLPAIPVDAAPLPLLVSAADPRIRRTGRFDISDPAGPRCSWPAGSVTLKFRGTALNVVLNDSTNNDAYEVVVDDHPAGVLTTRNGVHVYALLRGASNVPHAVTLVKRTEAFFGNTQFQGFQLPAGSRMLALPPRPARRMEVIGDSFSCGYGNEAKDQHEHFSSATENAYLTYGAITARTLGAEYACIAWSGRRMWPNNTMDEVYGRTIATDPNSRWDFSRWVPQAVVIALGGNDIDGGIPDGSAWEKGYETFIARVRKNYPQAVIYCAANPLLYGGKDMAVRSYLHQIVQDENAAGDSNVRFLNFAMQQASDGYGADWHPNVKTHQIMASVLTAALQKDLGWTPVKP